MCRTCFGAATDDVKAMETPEYRTAFRALCEAFRTVSETQTKAIEEVKAELAETNERLTKVPKASVGRKVMKFAVPILPTTDGHDDMVWIWLSSFPPTVTEDDIRVMVRECLSFDDDEIIDVKMLVKKDADISKLRAVSFKVGVDLKHEETALDGDNWPAGVSFREFIFYDQKRFETELMEKHLSCIENIRRIAGPHDVIVVAGDYNQGSLVWKHLSGNRSYVDPQLTRTRTEKERLTHGVMLDGMANCNMHQCNLVKNDRNRILDLIFVSDDDCTVVAAADEPLVPLDAPHPALVFDIDASRTVFVQQWCENPPPCPSSPEYAAAAQVIDGDFVLQQVLQRHNLAMMQLIQQQNDDFSQMMVSLQEIFFIVYIFIYLFIYSCNVR
ncbi:hypothetical protein quinque_008734 [Culex quinquefasciatus]